LYASHIKANYGFRVRNFNMGKKPKKTFVEFKKERILLEKILGLAFH
jgi:hypothetical protein